MCSERHWQAAEKDKKCHTSSLAVMLNSMNSSSFNYFGFTTPASILPKDVV